MLIHIAWAVLAVAALALPVIRFLQLQYDSPSTRLDAALDITQIVLLLICAASILIILSPHSPA